MEERDRISKKEIYKEAKRVAKRAVAEGKSRAYEDFYKKLDTKEGLKHFFKLAKAKPRNKKDVEIVRYTKNENVQVLLTQEENKTRCGTIISLNCWMNLGGRGAGRTDS